MKVLVCIKQIIDPEPRVRINLETNSIDERDIKYVMNPVDEFAIEEALNIRDTFQESEVVTITMGPPRTKRILIDSLAMGADRAVHLWDQSFEGSDNWGASLVLARAIELVGYDLILCGRRAIDDNAQQVPATIAALLGLPFVSGVTSIDIDPSQNVVTARRSLERGDREIVECGLPAIFSVETDINIPRYATLKSRLRAERTQVDTWDSSTLRLSPDDAGHHGSMIEIDCIDYPRPRTKKLSGRNTAVPSHLYVRQLMQGRTNQQKNDNLLEGSPEDVAAKALQFLTEKKIFSYISETE